MWMEPLIDMGPLTEHATSLLVEETRKQDNNSTSPILDVIDLS